MLTEINTAAENDAGERLDHLEDDQRERFRQLRQQRVADRTQIVATRSDGWGEAIQPGAGFRRGDPAKVTR